MSACECLTGLVAVDAGICEVDGSCRYYLKDLPGISRKTIELITNQERATVAEAFASLERRATEYVRSRSFAAFAQRFRRERANKYHLTGSFDGDVVLLGNSGKLVGKVIDMTDSAFLEVRLRRFLIYTDAAVTDATLYVYELETGSLLDSITFSTTGAGFHSVPVTDAIYRSRVGLFIAYDAAEINTTEADGITDLTPWMMDVSPCDCGCRTFCKKYSYTGDPAAQTIFHDDLESDDCGIVLEYAVSCSFEAFLCDNIDYGVAQLMWYAIGMEFYKESQFGEVLNWLRLMDPAIVKDTREQLEKDFNAALEVFVQSADADGVCFHCVEGVNKVIELP